MRAYRSKVVSKILANKTARTALVSAVLKRPDTTADSKGVTIPSPVGTFRVKIASVGRQDTSSKPQR